MATAGMTHPERGDEVSQNSRKFAGIFLLIGSLILYPAAVIVVHDRLPFALPAWGEIVFFAIAGFGWALPAGAIIKWMVRPDDGPES